MSAPAGPAASPVGEAIRRAGPVALAGIVSNGLAVVVTVGLARILGDREYGSLIQLFGVLLVLQMPGSALLVAVVRRVTAWDAAGRSDAVAGWARRVRAAGLAGVTATAVLALVTRRWIAGQLSLDSAAGVAEILTAGAVWLVLCVERGFLQSRLAFPRLAANLGVEAAGRTVAILALAGTGVGGAAAGQLLGLAAAAGHARWAATRALRAGAVAGEAEATEAAPMAAASTGGADVAGVTAVPGVVAAGATAGRRQLLADAGTALATLALLALLQSLDVIVLGREAPRNAGDYAAVSVSSKALVYLAIALANYLLPEVATRFHRGEHALRQLSTALLIVAVPAVVLLLAGVFSPRLFLAVFFGERLDDAAAALAPLALAMAFLAASVLFAHYLLGAGRGRVAVAALGGGALVLAVAVTLADGVPVTTARVDVACQAAVALVLGALVRGGHRRAAPAPVR